MSEIAPVFHVLCRTARRPNFFADCVASFKAQTYRGKYLHVGVAEQEMCMDAAEGDPFFTINYAREAAKDEDHIIIVRYEIGDVRQPLFYNDYLNEMKAHVPPSETQWIMYLDDDDCFTDRLALEKIAGAIQPWTKVVVWKGTVSGPDGPRVLPPDEEFANPNFVAYNNISTLNFAIRADMKRYLHWKSDNHSNYYAFDGVYGRCEPEEVAWVDAHLMSLQDPLVAGMGKAIDKPKRFEEAPWLS